MNELKKKIAKCHWEICSLEEFAKGGGRGYVEIIQNIENIFIICFTYIHEWVDSVWLVNF
jgi:hypothetical protein